MQQVVSHNVKQINTHSVNHFDIINVIVKSGSNIVTDVITMVDIKIVVSSSGRSTISNTAQTFDSSLHVTI